MVSFCDVLKYSTGEVFWKNTPVGNLETGFEALYVEVKTVTKLLRAKKEEKITKNCLMKVV